MSPSAVIMKHESSSKVLIYESEAQQIAAHTRRYLDCETGGDLFGYWTHSHAPVISLVLGPGSNSRHGRTSFFQDELYLKDLGADLFSDHGLQHIGAWHSHHQLGLDKPSTKDIRTAHSGIQSCGWPRFLLVITTLDMDSMVRANYYAVWRGDNKPTPLRIVLLPGVSPFRTNFHITEHDDVVSKSIRDVRWKPGPFTPRSPSRRPFDESISRAWFTSIDGKNLLLSIVQGFANHSIPCRIFMRNASHSIRVVLSDCEILLPHGFPDSPPQIVSGLKEVSPANWASSPSLVEWYLAIRPFRTNTDDPVTQDQDDCCPKTDHVLLEPSDSDAGSQLERFADDLHSEHHDSHLLAILSQINKTLDKQQTLVSGTKTDTKNQLMAIERHLKQMSARLTRARNQQVTTSWVIVAALSAIAIAAAIFEVLTS